MADGFDIVDYVFAAVEKAGLAGFVLYKDKSGTGETNNHITVRTTGVEPKDCVNKAPVVNVNIFVKLHNNGMVNRPLTKESVRKVTGQLNNIDTPAGMYWKSRIVWTEPMGEAKEGFDCTNIRLEVITELN